MPEILHRFLIYRKFLVILVDSYAGGLSEVCEEKQLTENGNKNIPREKEVVARNKFNQGSENHTLPVS